MFIHLNENMKHENVYPFQHENVCPKYKSKKCFHFWHDCYFNLIPPEPQGSMLYMMQDGQMMAQQMQQAPDGSFTLVGY